MFKPSSRAGTPGGIANAAERRGGFAADGGCVAAVASVIELSRRFRIAMQASRRGRRLAARSGCWSARAARIAATCRGIVNSAAAPKPRHSWHRRRKSRLQNLVERRDGFCATLGDTA